MYQVTVLVNVILFSSCLILTFEQNVLFFLSFLVNCFLYLQYQCACVNICTLSTKSNFMMSNCLMITQGTYIMKNTLKQLGKLYANVVNAAIMF